MAVYEITYEELVHRFRILRHEELPEDHKAALRIHGIDPDDNWSLVWSFPLKTDAEEQLKLEQDRAASWQTYRIQDGGTEITVTRPIW